MSRSSIGAASAVIAFALCSAGAGAADERAGRATRVQADSFQKHYFAGSPIVAGDPIYLNATIYTKTYGTAEIRLEDDTELLVGPNSSILIDAYVYAAGGGASLTMSLGRGALRVISGQLAKDTTEFRTEVATIGVRGTRFWLDVDTPGLTRIWADEGTVIARPVDGDRDFILTEPVYAECDRTTCRETWPPPKPIVFPRDPRPPRR